MYTDIDLLRTDVFNLMLLNTILNSLAKLFMQCKTPGIKLHSISFKKMPQLFIPILFTYYMYFKSQIILK